MHALELLQQDHQQIQQLFRQVEATADIEDSSQHEKLFKEIQAALELHTYMEETVFYPTLEERSTLRELILESYEDHKQIKILLREMKRLVERSEKFTPKLRVMIENVKHHVQEEEEELFPKVMQVFSPAALEQLGKELEKAREESW